MLNILLGARTGLDRASTLAAAGEAHGAPAASAKLHALSPTSQPAFIARADDLDDDLDDDDDDRSDFDWAVLEFASVHEVDLLDFLVDSTPSRLCLVQAGAFATTIASLLGVLGILLI